MDFPAEDAGYALGCCCRKPSILEMLERDQSVTLIDTKQQGDSAVTHRSFAGNDSFIALLQVTFFFFQFLLFFGGDCGRHTYTCLCTIFWFSSDKTVQLHADDGHVCSAFAAGSLVTETDVMLNYTLSASLITPEQCRSKPVINLCQHRWAFFHSKGSLIMSSARHRDSCHAESHTISAIIGSLAIGETFVLCRKVAILSVVPRKQRSDRTETTWPIFRSEALRLRLFAMFKWDQ